MDCEIASREPLRLRSERDELIDDFRMGFVMVFRPVKGSYICRVEGKEPESKKCINQQNESPVSKSKGRERERGLTQTSIVLNKPWSMLCLLFEIEPEWIPTHQHTGVPPCGSEDAGQDPVEAVAFVDGGGGGGPSDVFTITMAILTGGSQLVG